MSLSRPAWHDAVRAASFFCDMKTESTCATKGGSVAGYDQCPACGWPELERISPERLHLLCGHNGVALPPLPSGLLPVHGAGRWYVMTEAEWSLYRSLCAHRDEMLVAQCAEGLAA